MDASDKKTPTNPFPELHALSVKNFEGDGLNGIIIDLETINKHPTIRPYPEHLTASRFDIPPQDHIKLKK